MDLLLSVIWGIFTLLFLWMAFREWKKSKLPMKSLKSSFVKSSDISISLGGLDLRAFTEELEKANQESHKIAATSFFLATLTALASLIISLI